MDPDIMAASRRSVRTPLHWLVGLVLVAVAVASAVLAWQVSIWFFLAFPFAATGAYGAWLGMSPGRLLDAAAVGEQDAGTGPAGFYLP